jgi:hypothetical protein
VFLACGKADISRLTGDFALDVIECADTVQRLAGDGGELCGKLGDGV